MNLQQDGLSWLGDRAMGILREAPAAQGRALAQR